MSDSFMLLIDFPELRPYLESVRTGLIPLPSRSPEATSKLVVKATKETILTAKIRGGFHIYRVPIRLNGKASFGLVSAFRDDYDNPLTIYTPIMEDNGLRHDLLACLSSNKLEIHFFDEINRERFAYRSRDLVKSDVERVLATAEIYPNMDNFLEAHHAAVAWFSARCEVDDENALEVKLGEPLYDDDFSIVNMEDVHQNLLYSPILYNLVRNDPGPESEDDIAQCLARSFKSGLVLVGPKKQADGLEWADIIAIDDEHIVIVQAKDSPNNETILSRSIDRKALSVKKLAEQGFSQLRGAIKAIQDGPLELVTDLSKITVSLEGRTAYGIVIVKEVFPQHNKWYVDMAYALTKDKGVMSILLSYRQLHELTHHLATGKDLVAALTMIFYQAREHGQFADIFFRDAKRSAHYSFPVNS